jgi:hypothetical protein
MKRIALIGTSLLLILSWNLSAQEKGGDRDREKRREHIEARKIGMITWI